MMWAGGTVGHGSRKQVNPEDQLDEAQWRAVRHGDGPLLVVAGPGSGKTRVITARAVALVDRGINPAEITVVTFTKAAAQEMQQRILQMDHMAVHKFKELNIGTFHAWFWRTLRLFGQKGKGVVDESTKRKWFTEALRRHGEDVRDDLLDELQRGVSWHKNNLMAIDDVPAKQHLLRGVWEYYEAAKTEAMAIDFDDMLSLTHELLCRNGQAVRLMQSQASHILVDEFQDTNYAQFEVLRMIMAAHGNICVVGDVDQAIYGWRAARPEYLLKFERYFPGAKRVELLANYRSSNAIVGYANRVIARNKLRHEVGVRAVRPGGEDPLRISPANERAEAASVVTMVIGQSQAGNALEDMAVLYRVNRYNHHLISKLAGAGIPFVVRDKERFLEEHWVVRELLAFFALTVDREQVEPFLLLARRQLKLTVEQCAQLKRLSGVRDLWQRAAGFAPPERVSKFELSVQRASRLAPAAALDYYMDDMGFRHYLQEYAARRGLARSEFVDICADLRADMEGFSSTADYLQHAAGMDRILAQARSESAVPGKLNLMTLHSAKGLEFDAVWIIGAIEGLLPHALAVQGEQFEEERRLFYVGCTRARDRLCIVSPKKLRGREVARSRFVMEGASCEAQPSAQPSAALAPTVGTNIRHHDFGPGRVVSVAVEKNKGIEEHLVGVRFAGGERKLHWQYTIEAGKLKVVDQN